MVKETRIIFEVGDLVALRYQCGGEACNQEMLFRLDNGGNLPFQCPACGKQWHTPSSGNNLSSRLLELMRLLHNANGNSPPVKIKFELDDPE